MKSLGTKLMGSLKTGIDLQILEISLLVVIRFVIGVILFMTFIAVPYTTC